MKRGLIIAGFALLSVAALAGWTRRAAPAVTNPCVAGQQAYPAAPAMYAPGAYDPYTNPYTQPIQPYGYAAAPAMYPAVQPRPQYAYYGQPAPAPRVLTRRAYAPAVQVRRGRPLSHSVAIVAGSSGVGAAVGALAGGGRGAAIGALAGGAGGFIYDRLTHNR